MSDNLEEFITQGQIVGLPKEKNHPFANELTEQSAPTLLTPPIEPTKRSSPKQRKASMEEYQQTYLTTPKIVDRQTIFISRTLRDEVDVVVRRLGDRKLSVSGFVEISNEARAEASSLDYALQGEIRRSQNLVGAHLNDYASELEQWKRMQQIKSSKIHRFAFWGELYILIRDIGRGVF